MEPVKRIFFVFVFLFSVWCTGQSQTAEVGFKEGASVSRIKVSLFDQVIYLPVSVNGHPAIDFVLDTGAMEISVIEKNLIGRLGLKAKEGGELRGAGADSVQFVRLDPVKLTLPDMEIMDPGMVSITMAHMEPYWGKPKYGLLGGNILNQVVTEIDYIEGEVAFFKADQYRYHGRGETIPINLMANAIMVKAVVQIGQGNEEFQGLFLIDTGVRNSFFNAPFVARNKLIETSGKWLENITGFGIGGEGFGKLSRVKSIQFGRHRIHGPVVELSTDTEGIAASPDFDGILGADLLCRFKVIFDYQRKEMILEPNRNFEKRFPYDASGMYLIVDQNNRDAYKVAFVVKNSPAEEAGIKKGDVLMTINGNPASTFNYEQIKNFFRQAGKTVTLKTMRDSTAGEFRITLRELL